MSAAGIGRRAAFAAALTATSVQAAEDTPWAYSTLIDEVAANHVEKASFSEDGLKVIALDRDGKRHESSMIAGQSADLVDRFRRAGVSFEVAAPEADVSGALTDIVLGILPPVILLGGLFLLARGAGPGGMGGDGGPMAFGKTKR